MPEGSVRLIWEKYPAGFKLEMVEDHRPPGSPLLNYQFGLQFVPLGGRSDRRQYKARLLEHEIFRDLANSARRPEPEGALEFVNKWGFLSARYHFSYLRFLHDRDAFLQFIGRDTSLANDEPTRWAQEVGPRFASPIPLTPGVTNLSRWRTGREHGRRHAGLDVCLEMKGGQRRLFLQAQSLLDFCVLEFFHATVDNIDLTACDACGKILPLHKQGRPKRYCNDVCKMAAWRAKHRGAINRTRRQNRAKAAR